MGEVVARPAFTRPAGSYLFASTTGAYATTYTGAANKNWAMVSVVLRPATTVTAASSTISYVHADHLGSTAAMTDSSGNVIQTLDYYPYGSTRVSAGSATNKRQYIGQFKDDSGLSYLNARYFEANRGQFLSEDPVFWEVGQSRDGKAALSNPQLLNSYSYAGNNPILNKDPSGRYLESGFDVAMLAISIGTFAADPSWTNFGAIGLDAGSLLLPGVPAVGGVALRAGKVAETGYSVYQGVDKATAEVKYVGITMRDPALRWAEHAKAVGSGKEDLLFETIGPKGAYTKTQAKLGEQSLIQQYGMQKNGGQLLNKINSISPSNPLTNFVNNISAGWASLPATVTQGGTTYYRNSSGLLSTTPGK